MTRTPFEEELTQRLRRVADAAPGAPTRPLSSVAGARSRRTALVLASVAAFVALTAVGLAVLRMGDSDSAEIEPRDAARVPVSTTAASAGDDEPDDDPDPDGVSLTTDDRIPPLTFRVGDREWTTEGIVSSWCGPDECYDASVDPDVSSPLIEWDGANVLIVETPFDVEAIGVSARPADGFAVSVAVRVEPVADAPRQWAVTSRAPVAAMSLYVWVAVAQDAPVSVNATIAYGAEVQPSAFDERDLPPLLDETVAASTLDVRACDAGESSALHIDDEPPGRAFLSRPWTDADGCLVRVDVITSYRGADHCDWQSAEVLTIGTPVLTRMVGPGDGTQYVRDPDGVYGDPTLVEGFDPAAVLPETAMSTPFFAGTAQVWLDDEAAYLVDGFGVERWPAGTEALCR